MRFAAGKWHRRLPGLCVAITVAVNLVLLAPERLPVWELNDGAVHIGLIRWATAQWTSWSLPLDGWVSFLNFGVAAHQYQTTPHVLMGLIGAAIGPARAYAWATWLLLSLWPALIWFTGRRFGLTRWESAVAAMLAPLLSAAPGHGYEHGSYTWRGFGVWAQLWGSWLLPPALAWSWRAVRTGRGAARAGLLTGLTVAAHFLTGYLAILMAGVWLLLHPKRLRRRIGASVRVIVCATAVASWVVVPLALGLRWTIDSQFTRGTYFSDSFGWRKVLGWLVTGDLYDSGRAAVVTVLVAIGLIVAVAAWRRRPVVRPLVALWVVSLGLFIGRDPLAPLLKLLPGSSSLLLHRYVFGLHLAGIFLAAVGVCRLARMLRSVGHHCTNAPLRIATATVIPLAFAAGLGAGWRHIGQQALDNGRWLRAQRLTDGSDGQDVRTLIDRASAFKNGRVYAGLRWGETWGTKYLVGSVPVFAAMAGLAVDQVGFTLRVPSLLEDLETQFNERSAPQMDLFGAKYIIAPAGHEPPVAAALIESAGRHRLYEVASTSGYTDLVDAQGSIEANRSNLALAVQSWLASGEVGRGVHPVMVFPGVPQPDALSFASTGQRGTILGEDARLDRGRVDVAVAAQRETWLLLKVSYHGRWRAVIDGKTVRPIMLAPGYPAVPLTAGAHQVTFHYAPFRWSLPLLVAGLMLCLAVRRNENRRTSAARSCTSERSELIC